MSYSLLDWVEIWQFFIPRRLELLKTHHCALLDFKQFSIEIVSKSQDRCISNVLHNFSQFSLSAGKIYLDPIRFKQLKNNIHTGMSQNLKIWGGAFWSAKIWETAATPEKNTTFEKIFHFKFFVLLRMSQDV